MSNATQNTNKTSKPALETCPLCETGLLEVTSFAGNLRSTFQMGQGTPHSWEGNPTVTVRCTEPTCCYKGARPGSYRLGSLYPLQKPNG